MFLITINSHTFGWVRVVRDSSAVRRHFSFARAVAVLWYFAGFFVFLGGFVFFLCLVYPMLPMSLDCPFLIATSVFSNVYLHVSTFHQLTLSEWWPHHVSFINYFVLVVKIAEMRLLLDIKQQRINRCIYVRTCIIISNIQNHKTNFYYIKKHAIYNFWSQKTGCPNMSNILPVN